MKLSTKLIKNGQKIQEFLELVGEKNSNEITYYEDSTKVNFKATAKTLTYQRENADTIIKIRVQSNTCQCFYTLKKESTNFEIKVLDYSYKMIQNVIQLYYVLETFPDGNNLIEIIIGE